MIQLPPGQRWQGSPLTFTSQILQIHRQLILVLARASQPRSRLFKVQILFYRRCVLLWMCQLLLPWYKIFPAGGLSEEQQRRR